MDYRVLSLWDRLWLLEFAYPVDTARLSNCFWKSFLSPFQISFISHMLYSTLSYFFSTFINLVNSSSCLLSDKAKFELVSLILRLRDSIFVSRAVNLSNTAFSLD